MATQTSTVPAVLDALVALLEARRATPGSPLAQTDERPAVVICHAPSGAPVPDESIQFFGTLGDQQWGALGNRRRTETYTIAGGIFVLAKRGAGQDKAKETRDRIYVLLAELEDALRRAPDLGLPIRVVVQLATANLSQGAEDRGRWADMEITLGVEASLVSN